MLEAVHLPRAAQILRQYPHELSGGMCQRVLIAMAFASRPKLVIADEPTTALDATIQARIIALMGEMRDAYGAAMLFITHDLRLAANFCDRVLVLYAGRAVEKGEARKLLSSPFHPYTRCLQLAIPSLSAPGRELFTLPGEMPGLARLGALGGCRFAPRCPNAGEICDSDEPKLVAGRPGERPPAGGPKRPSASRRPRRPVWTTRRDARCRCSWSRACARTSARGTACSPAPSSPPSKT